MRHFSGCENCCLRRCGSQRFAAEQSPVKLRSNDGSNPNDAGHKSKRTEEMEEALLNDEC